MYGAPGGGARWILTISSWPLLIDLGSVFGNSSGAVLFVGGISVLLTAGFFLSVDQLGVSGTHPADKELMEKGQRTIGRGAPVDGSCLTPHSRGWLKFWRRQFHCYDNGRAFEAVRNQTDKPGPRWRGQFREHDRAQLSGTGCRARTDSRRTN